MRARRSRGFTLIEVVVAFVLLSLVLVTGFEIFSGGLRRAGDLEDYSQGLVIAQSRLAAAGMEEAFREGQVQGESDDRRFRWMVATTRTQEGQGDPSRPMNSTFALYRVDVRVEWHGADTRAHSIELSTLGLGQRQ
jgi:general secretion pathway protein I